MADTSAGRPKGSYTIAVYRFTVCQEAVHSKLPAYNIFHGPMTGHGQVLLHCSAVVWFRSLSEVRRGCSDGVACYAWYVWR